MVRLSNHEIHAGSTANGDSTIQPVPHRRAAIDGEHNCTRRVSEFPPSPKLFDGAPKLVAPGKCRKRSLPVENGLESTSQVHGVLARLLARALRLSHTPSVRYYLGFRTLGIRSGVLLSISNVWQIYTTASLTLPRVSLIRKARREISFNLDRSSYLA